MFLSLKLFSKGCTNTYPTNKGGMMKGEVEASVGSFPWRATLLELMHKAKISHLVLLGMESKWEEIQKSLLPRTLKPFISVFRSSASILLKCKTRAEPCGLFHIFYFLQNGEENIAINNSIRCGTLFSALFSPLRKQTCYFYSDLAVGSFLSLSVFNRWCLVWYFTETKQEGKVVSGTEQWMERRSMRLALKNHLERYHRPLNSPWVCI